MAQASQATEDLATLSAVAEAVVHLSIADRTHAMYGADHPIGARATEKTMRAVERALELSSPIVLRFTPLAVFCGPHCLERDHPIYQRFARKLWDLGVGEVRIEPGVTSDELSRFLQALADGLRNRLSHREMEERLASAGTPHVAAGTLRRMLETRSHDEIAPISPEEERRQWDRLMRALARRGDDEAGSPEPEPVPGEAAEPPVGDYATAVVDYLKQVQRTQRQEQVLERSETGRKLVELLEGMNPELRHQILSQAVVAPEIDPAFLARLADLTGREDFVDSLRRLNASGQALPPSVFQTLALLSSVAPPDPEARTGPAEPAAGVPDAGALARDIGILFDPDRRDSYVGEGYDTALQRLEKRFRELRTSGAGEIIRHSLDLSTVATERHFLFTMETLLEGSSMLERESLRKRAIPEIDQSFRRFLDEGRFVSCRQALRLSRGLRDEERLEESDWPEPTAPWEDPDLLEALVARLLDRSTASDDRGPRELLQAIGEPVLDDLVDLLRTNESVTVRKVALESLVGVEASPAARLVGMLDPSEPWYVHRNALHVLSERNDASGVEAAVALWPDTSTRSRVAILRYLIELHDPAGERLLSEALSARDPELILAAARMALENEPPRLRGVAKAAEEAARNRRGSPLHLELLRLLARRGGEKGRSFVQQARDGHAPRMPWKRARWRERVDQILGHRP